MTLIQRDLKHIWHPCTHMHDFEQHPPLIVERAQGAYIHTSQGRLIDATSSWWCKSLGHGHPAVLAAIQDQLQRFEHVIGANTTHQNIVELSEHLASLSGQQHVFFASDGSCAVEIAMKLALHVSQIKGHPERNQFIALKNGYHGETLATLAVSDVGRFKASYPHMGLHTHFLDHIPYITDQDDPLWADCASIWPQTLTQLNAVKSHVCAIILEPIIQGAGGMLCYSADYLRRLTQWAHEHDIYVIADEIMTGLGRTGEWLACHHAGIKADLICLSKGLTSGSLPLSCVLIDHAIYEACYDPQDFTKSFLHSHTYTGNPLAVSAALATINTMHTEHILEQARALGLFMHKRFQDLAVQTGLLTHVRSIGAMVAGDLVAPKDTRMGYYVAQEAIQYGALLRPLGNTLYWLPPLNTSEHTIEQLTESTYQAIRAAFSHHS